MKNAFAEFKPHAGEAIKSIGIFTIPLPVLGALFGFIPIVGAILALVLSLASSLIYAVFGIGVQSEIALRISAGAPVQANEIWRLQMKRLVPWFIGYLIPALIAGVLGVISCGIGFILLGLFIVPIYMVEGTTGFDVNKRSFDLIKKDWVMTLVPPILAIIPIAIGFAVLQFVFALIPYAGGVLLAALSGTLNAVLGPFIAHLFFRIYVTIREKDEGRSIAHELQGAVGKV